MKTIDFIAEQKARIDRGEVLRKGEKYNASVLATNDRLYSYGFHYPLLFRVSTPSHRNVWVCNTGGYSATTRKHISYSSYLAEVCAPIGGTHGQSIDYDDVVSSIKAEIATIESDMLSKKRKDTAVYRGFERQLAKLQGDLSILTV